MKHLLLLLPLLLSSCYDPITDVQTRTEPHELPCDSTTSLTITIQDEWDGITELNY